MARIEIPPRLPHRGNGFSRGLGRGLLALSGWRLEGRLPDRRRFVAIMAPHTSNWDFYFGICAVFAMGLRVNWIGKHTLFRKPFGSLMRWLGGAPVARDTTRGRVGQVVNMLNGMDRWILGLSPEGTRGQTERWHTGFYHIARGAGVPILLCYLDYTRRVVGLGPLFETTGDVAADLDAMRAFYDASWARYPAGF